MAVVVPLLSGVTTGYLAWLAEERDTIRFDHMEYWGGWVLSLQVDILLKCSY